MEGLFNQDSYSEFMPLRQSSTLGDETLLMNGTDLYANMSTVWHEGFLARENAKQKASTADMQEETLNSTLSDSSTLQATCIENCSETLRMEALSDSLPKDNGSLDFQEESTVFYSALDFTLPQEDSEDTNNNERTDQGKMDKQMSFNDTLTMDEEMKLCKI